MMKRIVIGLLAALFILPAIAQAESRVRSRAEQLRLNARDKGAHYGRRLSAEATHGFFEGNLVCIYAGGTRLACENCGTNRRGADSWADDMNEVFDTYPDSLFSIRYNGDKLGTKKVIIEKLPVYDPTSKLPEEYQPGRQTYMY